MPHITTLLPLAASSSFAHCATAVVVASSSWACPARTPPVLSAMASCRPITTDVNWLGRAATRRSALAPVMLMRASNCQCLLMGRLAVACSGLRRLAYCQVFSFVLPQLLRKSAPMPTTTSDLVRSYDGKAQVPKLFWLAEAMPA